MTGEGIAKGIRKMSDKGAGNIDVGPDDWSVAVSTFTNGNAIDLTGTSGALDFDLATEELRGPFGTATIDTSGMAPVFTDEIKVLSAP